MLWLKPWRKSSLLVTSKLWSMKKHWSESERCVLRGRDQSSSVRRTDPTWTFCLFPLSFTTITWRCHIFVQVKISWWSKESHMCSGCPVHSSWGELSEVTHYTKQFSRVMSNSFAKTSTLWNFSLKELAQGQIKCSVRNSVFCKLSMEHISIRSVKKWLLSQWLSTTREPLKESRSQMSWLEKTRWKSLLEEFWKLSIFLPWTLVQFMLIFMSH